MENFNFNDYIYRDGSDRVGPLLTDLPFRVMVHAGILIGFIAKDKSIETLKYKTKDTKMLFCITQVYLL